MTPSINVHQCDYLLLHSPRPVFMSERSELVHIEQQIASLDTHISQLHALREALHCRSCELHNLLSSIHALPAQVLSYIFQQLIDPDDCEGLYFTWYRQRVSQAFVLTSVSSHFRRVAFETPGSWKGVPNHNAIRQASSLLQHCIALARFVKVAVNDKLYDEEDARSAVEKLLIPDVTRKIEEFELYGSGHEYLWIDKLGGSSFPMLDALHMPLEAEYANFNFRSLKTLTRFSVFYHPLNYPIILPPSVQHLDILFIEPHELLSIFHHCPNLVMCEVNGEFGFAADSNHTQPRGPVTLNYLKQMSIPMPDDAEMGVLVEGIRLPSLEALQMRHTQGNTLIWVRLLCHNVSATLTTLVLTTCSDTLDHDNLYQLWRLPFPKLRELQFTSGQFGYVASAIQALASRDGEHNSSITSRSPALSFVLLRCCGDLKPYSLLDLLKKWRIGTAFRLHSLFTFSKFSDHDWSPELREELKSIVGGRQIAVTWGELELCG